MKNIFFTIFSLVNLSNSFSQEPNKDDYLTYKFINNKGYSSYEVIWASLKDEGNYLNGKIMELLRYNDVGGLEFKYRYNLDVVNNIDSTTFFFDTNNNLIRKMEVSDDAPVGESQINFSEQFGGTKDTSITLYEYNNENLLIKKIFKFQPNSQRNDITTYKYDQSGNLIKESYSSAIQPENNDRWTIYKYDSNGFLIQETKIRRQDYKGKNDSIITTYTYFPENKLIEKKCNGDITKYSYKENLLISKTSTGKYARRTEYQYDSKNRLIEKKEFSKDELRWWYKYEYNNQGLLACEVWMNEETGKESTRLNYIYK